MEEIKTNKPLTQPVFTFHIFPGAMEKFETDSKLEFAEKNPKKLSSELLVIGEQKITVPSTAIIKTGEWR